MVRKMGIRKRLLMKRQSKTTGKIVSQHLKYVNYILGPHGRWCELALGASEGRRKGPAGVGWGRAARRREWQALGAWASEGARRSPRRGGGGAAPEQGAARQPCVRASGTSRFARGRSEVRAMEEEKYLPELMAEKDSLDPSFVHASRLLAEDLVESYLCFFKKDTLAKKLNSSYF
ncbi:PREDICTED: KH domain-containing, RNA-binding, signal transduction-associated protein 1-like [Galeopterus variegatus]|uniref:KH domain-containing, RNA-binding, signal transduction-associated protein 1-like n=1 Tax=Galeopterus variegatus TaxID=482537 RepID=A0ABM0RJ22_GALVR|nr:PREDICTED: KH domain-containing, RNA-binding, signal transduction-associated protein 1-like [Galeopterus variegatus]